MAGYRLFAAFLGAFAGLTVAAAAHADGLMVAEFSADQRYLAGSSPSASSSSDDGLHSPRNLYAEEIGGSEGPSWSFGDYTFSGVVNWAHRANYLAGERYSDEQFFSLGSKFAIGDSHETYLYHGYGQDRLAPEAEMYGAAGDAEMTRTGVSQNLYFADPEARVGVGYAYATGDREAAYQGLEGHEVKVSGEVAIGWGFDARLQAGYGLYSYAEYEGMEGDLKSARTNMSAGISRSFSPDLRWGLHYSYIDEEFATSSELSQSHRTWGLNLEYRY